MATVKEIFDYFENIVPTSMKLDSDNPGFLAGNGRNNVTKVLLALDITMEVIDEAKEYGAELVLSHHPLFFSTQNASTDNPVGRKLVNMLGAGISAICLHTNLDAAEGGVNDTLMNVLGISIEGVLEPSGTYPNGIVYGLGRYGQIEEMSLETFLPHCKTALNCNGLRYISAGKAVNRVAVCGGSGSSLLQLVAEKGCDTYVTADIKHSIFLEAKELGINLIDAGHYSTENVVMPVLEDMINKAFPDIQTYISKVHKQPEQYYM